LAELPRFDSPRRRFSPARPPTHQNSRVRKPTTTAPCDTKPLRFARKLFDGRGLYLLVMPNGGRYWRYNYRFEGRQKTLALGIHPDVSLDKAKARHQVARTLLAEGIDPSARKKALGNRAFVTSLD
jgi:hypothetical protein